ncbi:hypothetical protein [Salinigranum halophilum]|uniref:hypothetical protein n=1 Tax=Salinigranum halophilum TaxID=2565931 RepID=UPI0010A83538|nr:hypothetical protein [Salinigranum halophilum]
MNVPRGRLVRSRVVDEPGTVLDAALADALTGYAVFEPQDALLFDDGARCVVTFEAGVPVLVYDATTDRGGPDALATLASPGPSHVELYELPVADLSSLHEQRTLRVPPDMPAERLAGDPDLAARTREAAPDDRLDDSSTGGTASAVEAFLADEAKIDAIRTQAREEAQHRAAEWGLTDALADESSESSESSEPSESNGSTDPDESDASHTA